MRRTDGMAAGLCLVPLSALVAFLGTPSSAASQRDDATHPQWIRGHVCLPDGSPAAGAVVVASVGGETVTGADGSFALAVQLPLDAESVEVTATVDGARASGSLVASARFVPAALAPTTSVGRLALTLSPDCHPRWQPTFGSHGGTDRFLSVLTVFDDGGGPALYAGGSFNGQLQKWNGSSWTPIGTGLVGAFVHVLAVQDGPDGAALLAGGSFRASAGGDSYLAKWGCRSKSTVKPRKL